LSSSGPSKSRVRPLFCVVEDYAEAVALTRTDGAHAMTDVDAIIAACAGDRTVAIGKNEGFALLKADRSAARLGPRTLLDQEQLAANEIISLAAEEAGHLQRERNLAIEVLMQAVIATGPVVEDQRSRLALSVFAADFKEAL